eukprot:TRINITY_DN13380_c0_g1_i2.p1 TRINITY_DN13380_c0_g1~~TRINITY_DN13380_c0_g1_i2.p1  ORF type:complete len:184 (-),score=25.62 TRINITY_DN13380_c0_g1_i2:60-554(-)
MCIRDRRRVHGEEILNPNSKQIGSTKNILKNHYKNVLAFARREEFRPILDSLLTENELERASFEEYLMLIGQISRFSFETVGRIWNKDNPSIQPRDFPKKSIARKAKRFNIQKCVRVLRSIIGIYFKRGAFSRIYNGNCKDTKVLMVATIQNLLRGFNLSLIHI